MDGAVCKVGCYWSMKTLEFQKDYRVVVLVIVQTSTWRWILIQRENSPSNVPNQVLHTIVKVGGNIQQTQNPNP